MFSAWYSIVLKVFQRILCAWIIRIFLCVDSYLTVVSKPIRSGDHGCLKVGIILLLVVTFTSRFTQFLLFSNHLCTKTPLLIIDQSYPMMIICCVSSSDWNKTLRITNFCSNDSMEIFFSATSVKALNLSQCAARALLPSLWKQRYYLQKGKVYEMSHYLWILLDIAANQILTVLGQKRYC